MAITFCSDRMIDSHFIVQTNEFMLTDATAVTLGQGHGKVIQYILTDLYILCPKYVRCSLNGFDVRERSRCGGGRDGGRDGDELKTDRGDLNIQNISISDKTPHTFPSFIEMLLNQTIKYYGLSTLHST